MIGLTLAGRLTKDSEMRYTADGKGVLGFTVACDVGFGEKKGTSFIDCAMWGKRGESLEPWLKKGVAVTVMGVRVKEISTWESGGKSGINESLSVHELALQGSKGAQEAKPSPQGGFRDKPAQRPAQAAEEPFKDDPMPF